MFVLLCAVSTPIYRTARVRAQLRPIPAGVWTKLVLPKSRTEPPFQVPRLVPSRPRRASVHIRRGREIFRQLLGELSSQTSPVKRPILIAPAFATTLRNRSITSRFSCFALCLAFILSPPREKKCCQLRYYLVFVFPLCVVCVVDSAVCLSRSS